MLRSGNLLSEIIALFIPRNSSQIHPSLLFFQLTTKDDMHSEVSAYSIVPCSSYFFNSSETTSLTAKGSLLNFPFYFNFVHGPLNRLKEVSSVPSVWGGFAQVPFTVLQEKVEPAI